MDKAPPQLLTSGPEVPLAQDAILRCQAALPAGAYSITLAGGDDANLLGDFDISGDVSIVGSGAGTMVIDGNGVDRVIVPTSTHDPQVKLQALSVGAMDFLSKPVDPSELALRIRNTLAATVYRPLVDLPLPARDFAKRWLGAQGKPAA